MTILKEIEEAVAYRLVDDGYTPLVARVVSSRVFSGKGEAEDIRAVFGALGAIVWPVLASPTLEATVRSIFGAVEGQIRAEIYRGRKAEAAADE